MVETAPAVVTERRRCEFSKGQADATKPPWRKILWEQQPYPDNYVDQTFLASVLTYTDTTQYELLTLVKASTVVTQQLSTVAIFCMLFLLSYYERLSAGALLCLELVLLLLGLAAAVGASRRTQSSGGGGATSSGGGARQINDGGAAGQHGGGGGAGSPPGSARALRAATGQLLILVCWLLGLSPILATLTRTFSDDTICALTSGLFLCHLVSHDYAYASHYSSRLQGSLSLNAAIFACVLLAARLPSTTHVFALTSLGVLCFMLLPALSRTLHALPATQYKHTALRATAALVALATAMLFCFSKLLGVLYLVAIFTTSLLCPMLLVHLQQYRADIQGPWDVAVRAFLRAQSASQT